MVAPIDYTLQGVQSPFQALQQGMQFGAGLAQAQAQRQQLEAQAALAQQKAAAEQAAMERQRQIGTAMSALIANPNRTAQDYEAVASMLPEKEAASLRANFEMRTKEQQGKDLGFAMQTMSAFDAGSPDVGLRLLREKAQAERNSGREDQAKAYENSAEIAEMNPQAASAAVGVLVSRLPGGKDALDAYAKVREEQRVERLSGPQYRLAVAAADKGEADAKAAGVVAEFARPVAQAGLTKAQSEAITAASNARFADALNEAGLNERNWNVRNVQNQINVRSRNLQLDEAKVGAEVQLTLARIGEIATSLPDQAKKDINEAAVTAGISKQQAMQLNSLAAKLDQEGGGWGLAARGAEWFKRATGSEGYVSSLRQEFTRLRNSAVVQSLPKGAASDRDIALMLEGFPPATADAKYMASFLRGMAKAQEITAATENARVDWLSQNRGLLGRARSEFKAGDFTAQPGETWVDLSQRIVSDVTGRYATGGAPGAPIPTTMPPAPAAPAMPPGFRLITPPR